jgi:outer membrane receptor for ferrienterochelin and colicins
MKHVLLAIALLFSLFTYSQITTGTIKGRVTSGETGLEFASVGLLKTEYSSTTDTKGYFEFKNVPQGKYQLKITYVGYENFQQEVAITGEKSVVEINIPLIELSARLKEVVVTGALREVTKLQSVTPVDVYTAKYFDRNPPNNLFDALANVNGLFADIDNGVSNTSDVQINGLEGNYTMILVDGVPAMNGLAGIYALNAMPMAMINKVEILKGAASAIYGSDAIAGVINIKTKNPFNTPKLALNVYLDSKLNANIDLTATAKLKKASALFAFSGQGFDYKWDIDGNNFVDMPLTNRGNFYNKWSFVRPQNKVAFIYARYLFEDRFGGEMNFRSKDRGSDSIYGEAIRTHQWQAGFQYQLPGKEKILLIGDYSEHHQQAYYAANYFCGIQRTAFSQLSWSKKVDTTNELLMGVAYRLNYYSDNTSLSLALDSNGNSSKFNHIAGVFIEDEISIAQLHKLVIGARFDYSSQSGPVFTPRLNYKWNSRDGNNVVRIGIGTGYRTPNLLNEGFGALNGSRHIYVAEKLKPEIALNASADYNRVQTISTGLLNINVNGFYTYFVNLVNPDYEEDPALIVYRNSKGGAMAGGFSVYTDFTFNYPLKVGVGFTYTNVFEIEKDDHGNRSKKIPPHVPPFVANFYLSYTFPAPQISIDWTGNLVSPMKLTTVPDDFRADHSPWFTIQNIQFTKKFNKGIELYLGIKNLFNFVQKEPLLRPFDPFNRNVLAGNPFNYRFDTTHGFMGTEGIKGFVGFRYTLQ